MNEHATTMKNTIGKYSVNDVQIVVHLLCVMQTQNANKIHGASRGLCDCAILDIDIINKMKLNTFDCICCFSFRLCAHVQPFYFQFWPFVPLDLYGKNF